VLLAGWHQGRLVATGMLDLAMPENQAHRAEVEKILVHPSARRLGYARRMLLHLEDAARAAGRSLLVLDTRSGDGGEALYRAEGWQEYGRLAGHARGRDRELVETVFMAKWIS
jgi:GNAT superfamily N-acetyltransferase